MTESCSSSFTGIGLTYICLQETWLLGKDTKNKLSEIDSNYISHGVSGVGESKVILRGRPKGECAILWQGKNSERII